MNTLLEACEFKWQDLCSNENEVIQKRSQEVRKLALLIFSIENVLFAVKHMTNLKEGTEIKLTTHMYSDDILNKVCNTLVSDEMIQVLTQKITTLPLSLSLRTAALTRRIHRLFPMRKTIAVPCSSFIFVELMKTIDDENTSSILKELHEQLNVYETDLLREIQKSTSLKRKRSDDTTSLSHESETPTHANI